MVKRFKVLDHRRKSCYALGKFCKKYEEDEIVVAVPGTLGIMTFKSLEEAEDFQRGRECRCSQIVAVTPIGRGKAPKKIAFVSEYNMGRFYAKSSGSVEWRLPPKGTICYPAVLVLE